MKAVEEFGWSRIKQNVLYGSYNLPAWEGVNGTFRRGEGDRFALDRTVSLQFGMFKIYTQ